MTKWRVLMLAAWCLSASALAGGGLDAFLGQLDTRARTDRTHYASELAVQFRVSDVQVRMVLSNVSRPGDAFMVFEIGRMTHQPPERVLGVYRKQRGKGWGVIARELGIKPGSAEFHALKRGHFQLGEGTPAQAGGPGRGRGHGHGRPE